MWGFGGRWWKVAGFTYPALQVVVVLATANHFLLDVLGGAACILLGYTIVGLIGRALGKTDDPGIEEAREEPLVTTGVRTSAADPVAVMQSTESASDSDPRQPSAAAP
jgi:hypothetical protein